MKIRQLALGVCFVLSAVVSPLVSNAGEKTLDLGTTFQIQGKVPDMQQQIESSGFTFKVQLRDIKYSGKIKRTLVEPTSADRMTVWVSLKDAVLTIRHTDINGKRHSAECGPLKLTLGNRRDLWIAFDVERSDDKLQLLKTRFELPRDNWSVGSPSWVTTQGFGMTESKVVSGLRGGLSKRGESVEKQLIRVAPDIFAQVQHEIADELEAKNEALSEVAQRRVAGNETAMNDELVSEVSR